MRCSTPRAGCSSRTDRLSDTRDWRARTGWQARRLLRDRHGTTRAATRTEAMSGKLRHCKVAMLAVGDTPIDRFRRGAPETMAADSTRRVTLVDEPPVFDGRRCSCVSSSMSMASRKPARSRSKRWKIISARAPRWRPTCAMRSNRAAHASKPPAPTCWATAAAAATATVTVTAAWCCTAAISVRRPVVRERACSGHGDPDPAGVPGASCAGLPPALHAVENFAPRTGRRVVPHRAARRRPG